MRQMAFLKRSDLVCFYHKRFLNGERNFFAPKYQVFSTKFVDSSKIFIQFVDQKL